MVFIYGMLTSFFKKNVYLQLILLLGNFLNGNTFRGGAFGIRIGSINKVKGKKIILNQAIACQKLKLMNFIDIFFFKKKYLSLS